MKAATRAGVRKTRHANVVKVTRSSFLREVDRELRSMGLTRDEFVRRGREGSLTDDRARDLWTLVDADLLK